MGCVARQWVGLSCLPIPSHPYTEEEAQLPKTGASFYLIAGCGA